MSLKSTESSNLHIVVTYAVSAIVCTSNQQMNTCLDLRDKINKMLFTTRITPIISLLFFLDNPPEETKAIQEKGRQKQNRHTSADKTSLRLLAKEAQL